MSTTPQLTPSAARDQHVFRTLLSCFARPGTIGRIPHDQSMGSLSGQSVASSVGRCLLDHEVSFAILGLDHSFAEHLLRVTAARSTDLSEAEYVFTSPDQMIPALNDANVGTDEYPDQSATLIVLCDGFGADGSALTLSGPGIQGERSLSVQGVDPEAFDVLSDINADYPLGIDLILTSHDGSVACMPRTTSAEIAWKRDVD